MITFRERMKANNLTEEFIRIVQAPITTPWFSVFSAKNC
jgi:hypothetical protein